MRDFTKLLKNKFKSKKYFKKHSRLGYLPVGQSSVAGSLSNGLEIGGLANLDVGSGLAPGSSTGGSPSLSPQRSGSKQDVSERLADRLAELETRSASDDSSSTRITPQQHSEPKKSANGIFA
jgi:hypothetical protein